MRRFGLCKKGIITAVILALTLSGCTIFPSGNGKDDNQGQANIETGNTSGGVVLSGGSASGEGEDEGTSSKVYVTSEKSFASRIAGDYYTTTEYGDGFVISIENVFGNLYAYGGFVPEGENSNIYSMWSMEIIPENPLDLEDENITKCDVGVLSFSIMSNIGEYWQSPALGTIEIEGDGLHVYGENGNPFYTGDSELHLKRSDTVGTIFKWDMASEISNAGKDFDESLYGIWRQKDSDNPWYLSFSEGDEYAETIIYRKKAGEKVNMSKGICASRDSEIASAVGVLESDCTDVYVYSYELDGDELVLKEGSGMYPFYDYENYSDTIAMERIDLKDIPVAALYSPDDVNAIKGGLTVNAAEGERAVSVHFKNIDDIENNGTEFVRVGDVVFFRYYDDSELYTINATWADFRSNSEQSYAGCVCYYDLNTGECGRAFTDYGNGEIYYVDGKFYSEHFEANDVYSINYIKCCYPDGSGMKEHSDSDTYSSILAVSDDNSCFLVNAFLKGETYIDFGDIYHAECYLEDEEAILDAEFIDGVLYTVTYNYSDSVIRIREFDKTSEFGYLLGQFGDGEMSAYGYPSVTEFMPDTNESVCIGIQWVDGTNIEIQDFYVVKAMRGQENSAKIIHNGIPDNTDIHTPYFYFNGNNEMIFTTIDPKGEIKLENGRYGDLICYDSPHSAVFSIEDFIEEYPFGQPQILVTVFEEGEYVGGKAFVVTAKAIYTPENDIGWRQVYELNYYETMVIDLANPDDIVYLEPLAD